MTDTKPTLFYDFVDPLSYLLVREIDVLVGEGSRAEDLLTWHPLELRPPPTPLVTLDDESLAERWTQARSLAGRLGVTFAPPELVPWTRKAHEFVCYAAEHDVSDEARRSLFDAYLLDGGDIGRVDVLVGIAVDLGLDRTEAKAVLDVDRHEADVATLRDEAEARAVTVTPTLAYGDQRLEGFHNRDGIGTLLGT
ncbi:MAG: hypothetical protein HKN72_09800 [Gemmatimonadetes bacterium]|nr:hypothetical protein [Gemmatimonadota bacterium]